MPIYRYEQDEHPGKFIGLRVAVSISGELKQRYFSFTHNGQRLPQQEIDTLEQQAKEQEIVWKQEQDKYTRKLFKLCKEKGASPLYSTSVRGIKMKFIIKRKSVNGKIKQYYTPMFVVSGSNNYKRFQKNFNILTLGYDQAWAHAIFFYITKKGLDNPDQLMKRQPPVEKFMVIYKYLVNQKHQIPKERLPVEIWENKDLLKHLKTA
ncbi:MAG TPA: hypothetical protein ENJ32_09385 [Crenotrichaceae bacterium]|nr:hypothetical protein [Crenotrichaceae bacterium]